MNFGADGDVEARQEEAADVSIVIAALLISAGALTWSAIERFFDPQHMSERLRRRG